MENTQKIHCDQAGTALSNSGNLIWPHLCAGFFLLVLEGCLKLCSEGNIGAVSLSLGNLLDFSLSSPS